MVISGAARPRARSAARRSPASITSSASAVTGAILEPPRRLRAVGSGDFHAVGAALLEQLVDVGELRRDARVLDVGCGVGRVAIPLTGYLTTGSYEGFDVAPEMIAWCRRAITPRFPSFRFTLLDIANTHYNPAGSLTPASTAFPYPDREFGFAIATSLFTHMLPSGFLNYAEELARVVAPGGTFFGTFCLINADSAGRIDRREARLDLAHALVDSADGIGYRALDASTPETAVGLDEQFVTDSLERVGLTVAAIHPGLWSGRPGGRSYQDIVVARRA